MPRTSTNLVDILREFLDAQKLLHELAARFRRDELTFAELQEFVGDNEGSVLFRLKEKCHAVFRPEAGGRRSARVREALFDLAIGVYSGSCADLSEVTSIDTPGFVEEFDTAEVAEMLELTPANVKVRLHRARAALKKLLEPILRGEVSDES